jgi:hypothetical protein
VNLQGRTANNGMRDANVFSTGPCTASAEFYVATAPAALLLLNDLETAAASIGGRHVTRRRCPFP